MGSRENDGQLISLDMLKELQRMIDATVRSAIGSTIQEHEKRELENFDQRILELKRELVPDGDTRPHRDFHQRLIDTDNEQREFWKAARLKLLDRGVSVIFVAVKILAVMAFAGLLLKAGVAMSTLEKISSFFSWFKGE